MTGRNDRDHEIESSWNRNAAAWTAAVRERRIESRRAREAGGGRSFEHIGYDRLVVQDDAAAGPWDLIVRNFALLAENLAPLLRSLGCRLAPDGVVLIQTVHPWAVVAATPPYEDGWRVETFSSLAPELAAPMPWYFRTLASWIDVLLDAGFIMTELEEPRHPDGELPLSLLMQCRPTTIRQRMCVTTEEQ